MRVRSPTGPNRSSIRPGFELALEERERSFQMVARFGEMRWVHCEFFATTPVRLSILWGQINQMLHALAAPAGDFEVEVADRLNFHSARTC